MAGLTTANYNTGVGSFSLGNGTVTGDRNVAAGYTAMYQNTSGQRNVGVGYQALYSNTSGQYNVGIGYNALVLSTTAQQNVGVGYQALATQTTGNENTAIGDLAMNTSTTGFENVAVGSQALQLLTTGSRNTALGREALDNCTTGESNTGCGRSAGEQITTGSNNTCLGRDAGRSGQPGGLLTTQSNRICLGNNDVTDFSCKVSLTATSDARDKTDITDFTHGLSWINKLRPVTYRWDERINYSDDQSVAPDGTYKKDRLNIGLLAQEELEVEKEHGYGNDENDMLITRLSSDGKQYSMAYDRLVPILINAIKELSVEVNTLKAA